jgi:hypothetical protein
METLKDQPRLRRKSKTKAGRPTVKANIKLKLWLKAGGLCSFRGCAKKLTEHCLTFEETNFSNIAHIVGYEIGGPRGNHPLPMAQRNDYENLMLVCTDCHKLIDSSETAGNYSVELLQSYKKEHEDQLSFVQDIYLKGEKSHLLRCRANIGIEVVQISVEQMVKAISPMYPVSRDFIDIDMTKTSGVDNHFYWESKKQDITNIVNRSLASNGVMSEIKHLSVFALGPMPLLMHLGNCLSNKIPTDVFQRHRDVEDWSWKPDSKSVTFKLNKILEGSDTEVHLILSLSGKIPLEYLPKDLSKGATVYEVVLDGCDSTPTFLTSKKTLENFKIFYRNLISKLSANHKGLNKVHLFPAVPAPIAVLCGRELLHKVDPVLAVYDFNKNNGFFEFAMEVNGECK